MSGRMQSSPPPGERCRLLVIEDETVIAMELSFLLKELGHEVIGTDGTEAGALSLIRRHRDEIDLVFLDANLDGKPALQVAEELRQARIPYVMASGYEDEELRRLGFDTGCMIGKPYSEQEVASALLSARRPRRAD